MTKQYGVIGTAAGSTGAYLCGAYAQALPEGYCNYFPIDVDVTDDDQCWKKFESLGQRHETKLDGLIFAAGAYKGGTIDKMHPQEFSDLLDINLTGAYRVLHYAKKHNIMKKDSNIVIIGSSAAHIPAAGSSAYDVSKAGLAMLTKVASLEFSPEIGVIQLDPGMIRGTNMWRDTAVHWGDDEEAMERDRSATVPMGRAVSKEEVCMWINFLLENGAQATGRCIQIDGGKIAANPGRS